MNNKLDKVSRNFGLNFERYHDCNQLVYLFALDQIRVSNDNEKSPWIDFLSLKMIRF